MNIKHQDFTKIQNKKINDYMRFELLLHIIVEEIQKNYDQDFIDDLLEFTTDRERLDKLEIIFDKNLWNFSKIDENFFFKKIRLLTKYHIRTPIYDNLNNKVVLLEKVFERIVVPDEDNFLSDYKFYLLKEYEIEFN